MEVNGFEFFKMKVLSAEQLQDCFEIIKNNLQFEGIVFHAQDEDIWKNNILQGLQNKSNTFVIIKQSDKICGFISLTEQDKLYLSEIQFAPSVKGTKLILSALMFIKSLKIVSKYNEIYFYINNANSQSIKTFTHLGAQLIGSKNNSNLYVLSRSALKNFLSRFKK